MAPSNSDRNLLFGILALQMDFISRDALITALHTWVLDKATPLGHILRDLGYLSGERLQLLDALVEEHLRAHGDDAQQSLASLSSVSSVKQVLQGIDDPELHASLGTVGSQAANRDSISTVDDVPQAGPRFRVLRPHAKGGLGEISVAEDLELHREVALKEIQAQHVHDPHSRGRFLLEAEITGGLEHPGIVPVYSLGSYADGRPFYAMRFIRGDNLMEAIRRFHAASPVASAPGGLGALTQPRSPGDYSSLAFRQLLGRFVDVCQAVAYAHSRGVLHRDLKPGNVMLGKYGETLVVDWGLAKVAGRAATGPAGDEPTLRPPSGSGHAPTQAGSAVGTPEYMSPEQAAGRLDELGPASDVYSLGATLYVLLTGQPPFRRQDDLGETLRQVERGEFPKPRDVKKDAPAALEAVCLKGMALQPGDRYPTALALAADLEHWLADEAVGAYPEPIALRMGRWARRHMPLVTGTSAVLLTGVVALALGLLAVKQEQLRTDQQRVAAEESERDAKFQEQLAKVHQRRAEDSYRLAREGLDQCVKKVADDHRLTKGPLEDLRRVVQEAQLHFFQQFVLLHGDEPEFQAERGRAFWQLGTVTAQLAGPEEAVPHFQQAITILGTLSQDYRDNAECCADLATCYSSLGKMHMALGQLELSRQAYERSQAIFKALIHDHPNVPEYRDGLATLLASFARLCELTDHVQQAQRYFEEALDLGKVLASTWPNNVRYRANLSISYIDIAGLHQRRGRVRQAEQVYQQALAVNKIVIADDPKDPKHQETLATAYNNLAVLYSSSARRREAEEAFLHALAALKVRAREHPAVPRYQSDVALCQSNLGTLYRQMGRTSEAERAYQDAMVIQQNLALLQTGVPEYALNFGTTQCNLGHLMVGAGKLEAALTFYSQAVTTLEGFLAHSSIGLTTARENLRNARWGRARVLTRLGRDEEALQDWYQGIALALDDLITRTPLQWLLSALRGQVVEDLRRAKAECREFHLSRGRARAELGSWSTAAADLSTAIELGADEFLAWYHLALVQFAIGEAKEYRKTCASGLRRFGTTKSPREVSFLAAVCAMMPDAVADANALVQLARSAVDAERKDRTFLYRLGLTLYRAGQFDEAAVNLNQALKLSKGGNAWDWLALALVHHRLGNGAEAKKWLERAVQWIDAPATEQPEGSSGGNRRSWNAQLELTLLRREAEGLIKGGK